MLGNQITDPEEGRLRGMSLLNTETIFHPVKHRSRTHGKICHLEGRFANLSGTEISGYEIHMGETTGNALPLIALDHDQTDGFCNPDQTVCGTYLHGIFDNVEFTQKFLTVLAEQKHVTADFQISDSEIYKNRQYDQLADLLRSHLDMQKIYEIINLS